MLSRIIYLIYRVISVSGVCIWCCGTLLLNDADKLVKRTPTRIRSDASAMRNVGLLMFLGINVIALIVGIVNVYCG